MRKIPSTVKEWEEHIKTLSHEEKKMYHKALETLGIWFEFHEAYSPTRVFVIRKILDESLEEDRRKELGLR